MGLEVRIREDLRRSEVAAGIAAHLHGDVLDDEFGTLQNGAAGHNLVRELHLFVAEVGHHAHLDVDGVDPLQIVLGELVYDRVDYARHDRDFMHGVP